MKAIYLLFFLLFCANAPLSHAGAGNEMASAATNWLNALSPEQKAKGTFAFTNEERFDWHFIPKPRKGLPFKEMDSAQQKLASALLSSGLSLRGYAKAVTIMSLDKILKELEQGKGPVRDPDLYYFTVFGDPAATNAWGWRVEGHHLSLNFVVRGDEVLAATPTFMGSNPGEVKQGPRMGLNILGEDDAAGRALLKSFSSEQKAIAVITNAAPREIITGNKRKAELLAPVGLTVDKMSAEQKDSLMGLVHDYAYRHRPEIAENDLKKIHDAGFEKVSFAWAGGVEPGEGHYYRIQGPTFLIELDNTQDHANHIHTVWRDFKNDFGEDLLREHYDSVPHGN